ncbi:MAG: hypothetical protein K2H17_11085 [Duncaniella sp.]|uniref:hypothetical protein n=1 Tax=Duncaniella sp. TaxID=2518496 RepID=UPI0023D7237E|nr:hypothetical protein [Duncaniella sp.]MDE5989925.1 hypothetical protein [Duncaniella sp.]
MKKLFTLALTLMAFSASEIQANDFIVLTTPSEVLQNSIEDTEGAKAIFQTVVDNSESTEAEITAAMEKYMQDASPKPGYAFDMSFLLRYNVITDTKTTTTQLNTAWKTEIPNVNTDPTATTKFLLTTSNQNNGVFVRAYAADAFKSAEAHNKFIVYQSVNLNPGKYYLSIRAFAVNSNCVTLAAGEQNATTPINKGNQILADYSMDFKVSATQDIKLGLKRNSTENEKIDRVGFNDMYLYKLSQFIAITEDATEALGAAENVDVQLCRTFSADKYYPICLPFIVENWRDIFEDLLLWNNFTNNEELSFATVSGANTQARKPYLVKMKEDINEDNYLVFKNVNIQSGNAGSWTKEGSPVSMVGNWGTDFVPANSYYYSDGQWTLSDGSATLPAFSAYIASTLENPAKTLPMLINGKGDVPTGIEINISDAKNGPVNVYNLQGMTVKRGVSEENALEGLPKGIYIIKGKKIVK